MSDHPTPDTPPNHENGQTETKSGVDRRQVFRGGLAGLTVLMAGKAGTALGAGGDRQRLVLHHDNLRTSVADLFAVLRDDGRLRQRFIHNPTDVVLASILPDYRGELSRQRVSEANRFLFSLLANDDFRIWAEGYQRQINADLESGRITVETVDRSRIIQDMAAAMAEHGDEPLMVSMLNQGAASRVDQPALDVEVTVETYIAVAAVLVLIIVLIDFNVNDPGDVSTKSKVSAAQMRSLADHLTRHATRLKRSGELADASAEIR